MNAARAQALRAEYRLGFSPSRPSARCSRAANTAQWEVAALGIYQGPVTTHPFSLEGNTSLVSWGHGVLSSACWVEMASGSWGWAGAQLGHMAGMTPCLSCLSGPFPHNSFTSHLLLLSPMNFSQLGKQGGH